MAWLGWLFGIIWIILFLITARMYRSQEKKTSDMGCGCVTVLTCILILFIIIINCGGWTGLYGVPEWWPARWLTFWQHKPQQVMPNDAKQPGQKGTPTDDKSDVIQPGQKVTTEQVKRQIKVAEDKITNLEKVRASAKGLVEKRTKEKEAAIAKLKALGIKDSSDLRGNIKAQNYAQDLTLIVREIEALSKADEKFDLAILQANGYIRRLERALLLGESGISEQEFADSRAKILSIDDKLGDLLGNEELNPIQVEQVLKMELKVK